MVYRKTANVHATMAGKRMAMIEATLQIIAKSGAEGLSTEQAAKHAGISLGTVYRYFADKTELLAAATAHVLAGDIAAIRESETGLPGAIDLVSAIMALYGRFKKPRLVRALLDSPMYSEAVRDELDALIKRAVPLPPKDRKMAASVILGILRETYLICGDGNAAVAVVYSLRSLSVPNAAINRAIDRSLSHGHV